MQRKPVKRSNSNVIGRRSIPDQVQLVTKIPRSVDTYDKLREYMVKIYHIDVETDPDSDDFQKLYYNQDLRSMMGFIVEFDPGNEVFMILFPKYYVDWNQPNSYWTKRWNLLIDTSRVVAGDRRELKVMARKVTSVNRATPRRRSHAKKTSKKK
jgi:hypothetical protein